MGAITKDSLKQPEGATPVVGNITKGDERTIVFKEDSHIEGRRPGRVYTVDSSLAHHYCDVIGVAQFVEADGSLRKSQPTVDRAVKPPKNGRRS